MTELKDRRELLSLLNAKVQQFHVSDGGIPTLTQQDIALAFGWLQIHGGNKAACLYGRIKYCGEKKWANTLASMIKVEIYYQEKDANRWREFHFDWILNMCKMAIAESIDPHRCSACNGVAEIVTEEGKKIACETCNGIGKRYWRDLDRAWLMNRTPQAWNHWKIRYRAIKKIVDGYDDIICGALDKRLNMR